MTGRGPGAPRLLFVCTGNICRSPFAELATAAWARRAGRPVGVSSAGVSGLVGHPVDPGMAAELAARGIAHEGFAGSRLTAARVAAADVVLCMQRHHLEAVLRLRPAALRRTLLLDHAAALAAAGALPAAGGITTVQRGAVPAEDGGIPDPYGAGAAEFRAVAARIEACLDAVLPALLGGGPAC
ncbi:hypothetical protein CSPHI_10895 [Corynebacterium sphenisci DSM 44792]|uniref:protein-tyrosine-phosphatase n=1 Tax=Corynebacterium sphenisci DSM 44792 TaxID=1437874 RepID=A0A1L7CZU7_9CORY|nr:low molecular weight phosphatase family protein [Corynebacterium sphenisci]APT91409.1 hypothetical protein CSPHI_10895 [Corynebacterium sphenisci DSM 44792]